MTNTQSLTIAVDSGMEVSALLQLPAKVTACFVFAHGAGAGMEHPFMTAVAQRLEEHGIATLRYQFPYMERRSRRPDPPALCHAAVRAATVEAARLVAGVSLFAGGKSFGGRMTSQAQAQVPLPGVRGLAFLGFPLHPAGRVSTARAAHLEDVRVPMLFLQGTRDQLADAGLLRQVVEKLGARATLRFLAEADHSFHVPASTKRKDGEVLDEITTELARWIAGSEP